MVWMLGLKYVEKSPLELSDGFFNDKESNRDDTSILDT